MADKKTHGISERIFNKVCDFLATPIKWTETRIDYEVNQQEGFELAAEKPKKTNYDFVIALLNLLGLALGVVGYVYESIIKVKEVVEKVCVGAVCNDGWLSNSVGPGTCSWHSGIHHYVYSEVITHYNETYETAYLVFLIMVILLTVYRSCIRETYRRTLLSLFLMSLLYVTKYMAYAVFLMLSMVLGFVIFLPRILLNIPLTIKFIFVYFSYAFSEVIKIFKSGNRH